MQIIDLFCGIGGFRLGFEGVGANCVFSSDIDKYASETYFNNFGENPLSDIIDIKTEAIPKYDVLCAGFPCQPFSIGGHRKGFKDTRGTLFFEVERILKETKPKAFVLENVKGLVNHNQGNTLQVILNTLAVRINGKINTAKYRDTLGYHVYYKVLNSKDFGLPQNRERIFIVGFKDNVEFNFPEGTNDSRRLVEILEKDVLKNTTSDIVNTNIEKYLHQHKRKAQMENKKCLLAYEIRNSRCAFRFDGLAPTLTAKMGTGGNNVPVLVQQRRKLTTRECLRIQGFPESYKIKEDYMQSYKQIGNSVSVPVIKAIAKEIVKFI